MQRILIAEDDAKNNQMLREYLEDHGYTCTQAYSGSEAKLLFELEKFDLVLLDLMLPGIHGLEVARQISDRSRVIFITSYREHAVEAFDVNAVHYLVKPVTEERLFQALDRAVNQTEKVDIQALTIIKNEKHR